MDAARQVYERHVGRPDTASLVAEVDGRVIGFMSLEFRERLNRTTPQAWIPDLIVTETHRGIRAGRALLLRGFELARERGCWSVTLESGSERAVAHQLYLSAGMQDLGKYFLIDLD
jgi:ribosomal-protein-alanine N-acetyltransferase